MSTCDYLNPSRGDHEGAYPCALLAAEIQLANARLFELTMRPAAAHDPRGCVRLTIGSQVHVADFVSYGRTQNDVRIGMLLRGELFHHRTEDVDALNAVLFAMLGKAEQVDASI